MFYGFVGYECLSLYLIQIYGRKNKLDSTYRVGEVFTIEKEINIAFWMGLCRSIECTVVSTSEYVVGIMLYTCLSPSYRATCREVLVGHVNCYPTPLPVPFQVVQQKD